MMQKCVHKMSPIIALAVPNSKVGCFVGTWQHFQHN